jgi:hypothetical protein
MDITQLLVTVGSTLGIALVGIMAIIPFVMEARSGSGGASTTPSARTSVRSRHHIFHWPHHGGLVFAIS